MKIHYKKKWVGIVLVFKPETEAEIFQLDKLKDVLKLEGVESHAEENELWVGVASVVKQT